MAAQNALLKTQIGLYFGSFNPIHIGHLIIANYFTEHTPLEAVWLVVSPHNPLKKKQTLLADYHRLALVNCAIDPYPKLKASNIEFGLPQPNYTIDTLVRLEETNPQCKFHLIMGQDNLQSIHKWKNYELLLERYPIWVYPRPKAKQPSEKVLNKADIHWVEAPLIEIAATHIRQDIKSGYNVRPLLPEAVWQYIDEMHFYK